MLLDQGKLSKRTCFIPLNRIQAKGTISQQQAQKAIQVTDGHAHPALSKVSYEKDLAEAMAHVWGNTMLCDDHNAASRVAYDLSIRAVTRLGDLYEPSGTLSGGSAPRGDPILQRMAEMQRLEVVVKEALQRIADLTKQIGHLETIRQAHEQGERDLDLAQHQLSLLERQYKSHPAGKLQAEETRLGEELAALDLAALQAELKQAESELERVEREAGEFAGDRTGKLKELQTRLAKEKKELASLEVKVEKSAAKVAKAQQARLELEESSKKWSQQITDAETIISGENSTSLEAEIAEVSCRHTAACVKLEGEGRREREAEAQERELEGQLRQLEEEVEQASLEAKRLSDEGHKLQEGMNANQAALKQLIASNPWLKEDKLETAGDEEAARKRVTSLEEQFGKLRVSVNLHVMAMMERVEVREASLRTMLATIKQDRAKIQETIDKLLLHKREALDKCWRAVNESFGGILGDLLPGAFARLDQAGEDGLEIRVRLGGVWKEGLAELSGGQRSVIALSLILSLLQFKPAPFYILDEVDAALDLSHTQNIGNLLASRFKGSQFIVVSLKEGMFNNANVLFRTRFKDGISQVERTQKTTDDVENVKVAETKNSRPTRKSKLIEA